MTPWKSGTSAILMLSLLASASGPILTATTASAQLFPPQRNRPIYSSQVIIPAGTRIPVEYREAEKILVTEDETMPLTLTVAANIKDNRDRVLIPFGSQLVGQLQPSRGGSQFAARELIFPDGTRTFINASSDVVTRREEIGSGTDTGSIVKGAAIGAAAAAVLSAIIGDRSIGIGEVLGGAGLGALGGLIFGQNRETTDLVSIDPNTDLDVTLNSDLAVSAQRPFF